MKKGVIRRTNQADRDVRSILEWSAAHFGATQAKRYQALLGRAVKHVAKTPKTSLAKNRDDLFLGLRSFHVAKAATRKKAASHIIFYLGFSEEGETGVWIIRVLHDRMLPDERIQQTLESNNFLEQSLDAKATN